MGGGHLGFSLIKGHYNGIFFVAAYFIKQYVDPNIPSKNGNFVIPVSVIIILLALSAKITTITLICIGVSLAAQIGRSYISAAFRPYIVI